MSDETAANDLHSGIAPKPTAPPQGQDKEMARFKQFTAWTAVLAFGFGMIEVLAFAIFRVPSIGLAGLVTLGYGGCLLAACALLRRGRLQAAVMTSCLGLLLGMLLVAAFLPIAVPALTLLPVVVVALALPYVQGRSMRLLIVISWFVGSVIPIIGSLFPPTSDTPAWFSTFFRLSSISVAVALGFLLLWQFTNRLTDTLTQTQAINADLQNEIAERRRAEAALAANERRFRAMIENSSDGIVLVNAEGSALYASPSISRILGYSTEEIVGSGIRLDLVHPDSMDYAQNLMAELLRQPGKPITGQYRFRHEDGSWRWLDIVAQNLLDEPSVRAVVVNYRDITERKQAEEALRHNEERQRLVVQNMPVMMDALDEDGSIIVWNRECERVTGYSAQEIVNNPKANERLFPDPDYRAHMLAELAAKGDDYRDWEWETTCKDGSVRTIAWSNISGRFPIPGWAQWGIGVDLTARKRAETEISLRLAELEAVNKISTALRAAQTLDAMLPLLLKETLAVLGAGTGSIWLYEPAQEMLEMAAQEGWGADPVWPFKRGQGLPGQVLLTGEPYISRDLKSDPLTTEAARARIPEGTAGACVPIRAAAEIIGALMVNVPSSRELTAMDVRLLTTLAEIAGNAIHRMRLHEQTEQRLERLSALRAIDMAISSSLDLRITLNVLLDQVIRHLRVDAADILLLHPHTQTIEYAAGHGFRSRAVERSSVWLGQGYAGRAVRERRTISLPDLADEEPDLSRSAVLAEEGFQAYYGVPLIAKGLVEGVLEIFHRSPLHPGSDWLDFLEALAGQAAIAIDNAQLFNELQRSNLNLSLAYDATIEGWSRALDLRDKETEGHTLRVTEVTLKLARAMGMPEEELMHIRRGALLHDIGKMGIPDGILLKPGPLTDDEWVIMRRHPTYAFELLSPITYLRPALDIPYCHHEKWDGTGYPRGLKGEQIPAVARLFAIADVWDALRSDRPYRAAWPEEKVRGHIRALAGTHFDPQAVEAFLQPGMSD